MDNPFEAVVYDKDFEFTGFMVDPIYAHFVPSWWNQGYGSFSLAADNPHFAALQAKGARITVQYRGEHLMSGPVRSRRGDLVRGGQVTYQVLDDYRVLVNTLAWVAPDAPLMPAALDQMGQAWLREGVAAVTPGKIVGQTGYMEWPVDITTSEAAVKYLIRKNLVERLGRPVTVLPDQGRGGDPRGILPIVRMESLSEAIQPILNFSKLSVRVWQDPGVKTLFVDVVEPGEWTQVLTPESGIIRDGVYAVGAPQITRPIIGGPGETASRSYGGLVGPGLKTPDEVDYNDVIEVFSDADGDFEFVWPDGTPDDEKVAKYFPLRAAAAEVEKFATYFQHSIAARLKVDPSAQFEDPEDAPPMPGVSTLEMKLAETETFHYGGDTGLQLGDKVTVKAFGETFSNQVTECLLTFTRDDGTVVTPQIGQRQDDPEVQLATALANVAKALQKISTSK